MKLKELSAIDRPREKLERYGPEKLKDSELLAIILGAGVKGTNVIELSQKILRKWQNQGLDTATLDDLVDTYGLGKAKASEIVACFELGRRLIHGKQASLLLSPKDVWERMADIRGSKKEHFVVFYLDSRNQEISREIVSVGTLNESLVHPREVFEHAVRNNAASIVVSHNHPSGELEPSEADHHITRKLVEAGGILDITLVDHVIVTSKECRSMLKHD